MGIGVTFIFVQSGGQTEVVLVAVDLASRAVFGDFLGLSLGLHYVTLAQQEFGSGSDACAG